MKQVVDRFGRFVCLMVASIGLAGCVFHADSHGLPVAVRNLPLITYPAGDAGQADPAAGRTLIIMLSGDGGWAGLDQSLARSLARAGYAVVGWDSLRYYWHHHSPADAASDLARLITTFSQSYQRSRIVLIGYSRGADVLPFLYNRLPPAAQTRVAHIVLLGLAAHITFGYHLLSWIGLGPTGRAVMPEARRLPADRTSCLYGVADPNAACSELNAADSDVRGLRGGHHFNHDYGRLVRLVRQRISVDP